MSTLRQTLEEYIAVRRKLGFALRLPARLLRNFVAFVEANNSTYITTALAVCWAKRPRDAVTGGETVILEPQAAPSCLIATIANRLTFTAMMRLKGSLLRPQSYLPAKV